MTSVSSPELLQASVRRSFYLFALPLGVIVTFVGVFFANDVLSPFDQRAMPNLLVFLLCIWLVLLFKKQNFVALEFVLLSGILLYFNGLLGYTLTFPEGINNAAEIGMFGCWSIVIYAMFFWILGAKKGLRVCLVYFSGTFLMSAAILSFTLSRASEMLVPFYLLQVLVATSLLILIMVFFANAINKKTVVATEMTVVANTDSLTQVANRRSFEQKLLENIGFFEVTGVGFSVIILDIDHFKEINDSYGHNVGDEILKQLAGLINSNIRSTDTLARWGGEEFVILLPNASLNTAQMLAERFRQRIETYTFHMVIEVTASFGVSSFAATDDIVSLVARADQALYQAKEAGRNCVKAA